jgi:hypothetical protein
MATWHTWRLGRQRDNGHIVQYSTLCNLDEPVGHRKALFTSRSSGRDALSVTIGCVRGGHTVYSPVKIITFLPL